MTSFQNLRSQAIAISLFVLVSSGAFVSAQAEQQAEQQTEHQAEQQTEQHTELEGIIKGRNGPQIFLQTSDSPKVVVLLSDDTDVAQVEGILKARKKEMSMAALIPGLPVKVEGSFNAEHQFVAEKVRFKGNDLEQAQAIQAGLHETNVQTQQNSEEIQKQQEELAKQNDAIQAAAARFGQLDDYYILDEVPVYFGNGKVDVDPQYNQQLMALAEKAKGVNGYMIQIKGYASKVGSAELNQRLSQDRANNVSTIMIQQCHIPLTHILAPAAMGETQQVEGGDTADTEAANRRVVVRVLQNKGVAGVPAT